MAVYKDKKRGTWYTSFLYVDWTGKRCRKLKRGFLTKKAAQNWENHFKLHFAPVSGHWCVCQWPLGATSGRKLIDHFVFDHNVIMFCYPLEQRVG